MSQYVWLGTRPGCPYILQPNNLSNSPDVICRNNSTDRGGQVQTLLAADEFGQLKESDLIYIYIPEQTALNTLGRDLMEKSHECSTIR